MCFMLRSSYPALDFSATETPKLCPQTFDGPTADSAPIFEVVYF